MKTARVISMVLVAVGVPVLCAQSSPHEKWPSYGGGFGSSDLDRLEVDCGEVGMAVEKDPSAANYGYPHVAYFYKAALYPLRWEVRYTWYNGAAGSWPFGAWTDQVMETLQNVYEDTTEYKHVVTHTPQSIDLKLFDGDSGGVVYVYTRRETYTDKVDSENSWEDVKTYAHYVDIGGCSILSGPVSIFPGQDYLNWDADSEPLNYHRASLGFHGNGQPAVAYALKALHLTDPQHSIDFDCIAQLCLFSRLNGVSWVGSQWDTFDFVSSTVIDERTVSNSAIAFESVSLAMDRSLELGSECCVAYLDGPTTLSEPNVGIVRYSSGSIDTSGNLGGWTSPGAVVDGTAHCGDDTRVSLALDVSNPAVPYPCIAYEDENEDIMYTERDPNTMMWAVGEVVHHDAGAEDPENRLRVGSLCIQNDARDHNDRWVSVNREFDVGAGPHDVFVFRRDTPDWEKHSAMFLFTGRWRNVMDLDPRFGWPVVAGLGYSLTKVLDYTDLFAHVVFCPSLVIVPVEEGPGGHPIEGATVLWGDEPPVWVAGGSHCWFYEEPDTRTLSISHDKYVPIDAPPYVTVEWGRRTYIEVQMREQGCGAAPVYREQPVGRGFVKALFPVAAGVVLMLSWWIVRRKAARQSH